MDILDGYIVIPESSRTGFTFNQNGLKTIQHLVNFLIARITFIM